MDLFWCSNQIWLSLRASWNLCAAWFIRGHISSRLHYGSNSKIFLNYFAHDFVSVQLEFSQRVWTWRLNYKVPALSLETFTLAQQPCFRTVIQNCMCISEAQDWLSATYISPVHSLFGNFKFKLFLLWFFCGCCQLVLNGNFPWRRGLCLLMARSGLWEQWPSAVPYSVLLKSHATLMSQDNVCFPSGSKDDGVMQQPVVLFVFWIYFCIN